MNQTVIHGKASDNQLYPISVSAPAAATQTLTLVANPSNNDTCTVGGKTYTFRTTLTNVANYVLIGASASASLDNLIAAINRAAGDGTLYANSVLENALVSAEAGAGDTMVVTARTPGTAGNSIATTETFTNAGNVWGADTLTGGANAKLEIDAELSVSDIEIGAVELKNASSDERASIEAANTARTTATKVLAVQNVDEAGNVQPALGRAYRVSVSVTRPANTTAYTALDVIGDNSVITFASIGTTAGHIMLTNLRFEYDVAALPSGMTGLRLHLYNAAPTAISDNAAFDLPSGDRDKYLGYIDVGTPVDLGATLWSQNPDARVQVKLASASTSLYGILQTTTGFTPAANSEVFKLILNSVAVGA